MAESVQDLVRAALGKLTPQSSLEEIEKAAGIAKSAADTAKTNSDAVNARSNIRLEKLKAWPSLLVPIISLLTLLATVVIQAVQLQAARQQNEDTQWREFLKSVEGSSEKVISDITVAPRLKSFLNSPTYGSQVIDLSKRIMGQLVDQGGFEDLFNIVFSDDGAIKLSDLSDISHSLVNARTANYYKCVSLSEHLGLPTDTAKENGICTSQMSDKDALGYIAKAPEANTIWQVRQNAFTISRELIVVSQRIAQLLGSNGTARKLPAAAPSTRLSGAHVYFVTLKAIDFSNVDLSRANFDVVDLTDAVLKPFAFENFGSLGSNWWDAREVDQRFLDYLTANDYPGHFDGELVVSSSPITREYYVTKIARLCTPARPSCDPKNLNFGDGKFTVVALPQ